jgi:hypothetical protein
MQTRTWHSDHRFEMLLNVRLGMDRRLSINIPTKRGKEKSPADGPSQCEKEMDDHLLACHQFLKQRHEVTRIANDRAS